MAPEDIDKSIRQTRQALRWQGVFSFYFGDMKLKLLNRLPGKECIYPVYGLIVMLTYGWSLYHFFWILPSWIKFQTAEEIGILLCYILATNFVESLLFLLGLLFISMILPAKRFREDFVWRGGVSTLFILILFMFISYTPTSSNGLTVKYGLGAAVGLICVYLISRKINWARKVVGSLADRSIVFLYLSIPASLIALLVVLIRNI
ncbi:MAG: hypothetical protein EHM40_07300 [Chloroflexi bacterium]|nr:MAG: hypothetical protein EHM40_07300 [Chloroflexota bacterium]